MITSNIRLLTTGGTIGSTSQSETVNVNLGQQQLDKHIESMCRDKNITLSSRAVFNKNSEDIGPADWGLLIEAINEELAAGNNKILITHGTDTMAYSLFAVATCFAHLPATIVFTGSCFTLDHPKSDVSANLLGALATLSEPQLATGVYLSFLNANQQISVIDAMRLKPMSFDKLYFEATFDEEIGVFNDDLSCFAPTDKPQNKPAALPLPLDANSINYSSLGEQQGIFRLQCYPGMNAAQLCSNIEAGSCVIVSLYHCGTGPSQSQARDLVTAIQSRPDITFLGGAFPARYISKPYQATATLIKSGMKIYQNIQTHQLYVLAVLWLSAGKSLVELTNALKPYELTSPEF